MAAHPVPANYDELVAQYDPMVWCVIGRASRVCRIGPLSPEDAEDLRQHVYVTLLHRDYLARCRAYMARHNGRRSFTTSLYTFIYRLSMNWFRDHRVRRRYEKKATVDVKVVHVRDSHSDFAEHDVVDTRNAFAAIEAGIMLDEMAERLPAASREVLQACRLEGEVSGRAVSTRLPHRRTKTALRGLRRDTKEFAWPSPSSTKSEPSSTSPS